MSEPDIYLADNADEHPVPVARPDGEAGSEEATVYRCDDYDALKAAGIITRELDAPEVKAPVEVPVVETKVVEAPETPAPQAADVQVETA